MHCAEGGQQAAPGIEAALQHLFTLLIGGFTQLNAQGGDRIILIIQRVAQQQQSALFGRKEENQTHHHRQGSLIQIFFGNVL